MPTADASTDASDLTQLDDPALITHWARVRSELALTPRDSRGTLRSSAPTMPHWLSTVAVPQGGQRELQAGFSATRKAVRPLPRQRG